MTTPHDEVELRELLEKATPGPWTASHGGLNHKVINWSKHPDGQADHSTLVATVWPIGNNRKIATDNTDLIAAARNALPSLLDRLQKLREALDKIDARRYQGRYTVTPDMAWDEFCKANAELCAIYDEARTALSQGEVKDQTT